MKMVALLLAMAATARVCAAEVTGDAFLTNPIGTRATVVGSAARFSYDAAAHTVTANYDSTLPTAMLVFPLAGAINQNNSFTFSTTFTIKSISNFDDVTSVNGTAQLSFGLINSATTGTDRVGGGGSGAYDIATVDYFPTHNLFGTPTLSTTVVESAEAGASFFDKVDFPFGTSSTIPTFLNSGVPITATVSYDAVTHVLSSTFTASQLTVDAGGANTFTSSNDLDLTSLLFDANGFKGFNVDSFALTLWNDAFDLPTTAQIEFGGFSVSAAPAPEAGTLGVMFAGAAMLFRRRR